MYRDDQFELISKALQSTQHSLYEQGYHTGSEHLANAEDDFIKAVAHASEINNEGLLRSLYMK